MTPGVRIAISVSLGLAEATLTLGLLLRPADAQVLYGSIVGTVTDATGANVAHAIVGATHLSTGQTRQGRTDDAGRFVISDAWPGNYELKVQAMGFESSSRRVSRSALIPSAARMCAWRWEP